MQDRVKAAFFEWLGSLTVGLLPLIAHGVLHIFGNPIKDWDDNWSADILFISIGNSGFSILSVFSRMRKAASSPLSGDARSVALMAATMVVMFAATALYGMAVSGHATAITIWGAVVTLVASAICSLYFEVALAG